MRKIFMASTFMMINRLLKNFHSYKEMSLEMSKLRVSAVYLKGIQTLRLLFLSFVGLGACLMLSACSIMVVHLTVIFVAPWSPASKVLFNLVFALIYLSAAGFLLSNLLLEEKWIRMFNAQELMDSLSSSNGNGHSNVTEHDERSVI